MAEANEAEMNVATAESPCRLRAVVENALRIAYPIGTHSAQLACERWHDSPAQNDEAWQCG